MSPTWGPKPKKQYPGDRYIVVCDDLPITKVLGVFEFESQAQFCAGEAANAYPETGIRIYVKHSTFKRSGLSIWNANE